MVQYVSPAGSGARRPCRQRHLGPMAREQRRTRSRTRRRRRPQRWPSRGGSWCTPWCSRRRRGRWHPAPLQRLGVELGDLLGEVLQAVGGVPDDLGPGQLPVGEGLDVRGELLGGGLPLRGDRRAPARTNAVSSAGPAPAGPIGAATVPTTVTTTAPAMTASRRHRDPICQRPRWALSYSGTRDLRSVIGGSAPSLSSEPRSGAGEACDHRGEGVEGVEADADRADAEALPAGDEVVDDLVDGAAQRVGRLQRLGSGVSPKPAASASAMPWRSSVTTTRWMRVCSSIGVEAVAGGVADPADLALGRRRGGVGPGRRVDHAVGQRWG